MPDVYKSGDPVASYRRYYLGDKQHILKWTGRHVPHWIGGPAPFEPPAIEPLWGSNL
jgi:hypothetical protein